MLRRGGFTPYYGETFDILDAQGGLSGAFWSVNGQPYTDGAWDVFCGAPADPNSVIIVAMSGAPAGVPEPSVVLLLCIGLAGPAWTARRRARASR